MRGVRWYAIAPGSGYGDASEAYLSGLRAAGIPVSWTVLGWPSGLWDAPYGPVAGTDLGDAVHRDIAGADVDHDTVVVSSSPVWHERLGEASSGRLLAAYTTWETDRLPHEWIDILDRYDRILVPSHFNAEVFRASGVSAPVLVVPHIARSVAPAAAPPPAARDRFVFYVVATWTTRKAILDTVAAYLDAFTAGDAVELVIHTTARDHIAAARPGTGSGQEAATWYTLSRALAGRSRAPAITLSTRRLTRAQLGALHARGDCFVCLSRGEGWGLGAFDAAAHGNPVVVTGWGGTLDFLPAGYPYLVDHDLVPTLGEAPDAWWQPRPGERWAKARVGHAAALLRHVFEHRDEARGWGARLQESVARDFGEARVTRLLVEALGGTADAGGASAARAERATP